MSERSQLPAVVETGQLYRRSNPPSPYAVPHSVGERTIATALLKHWKYLLLVAVVAFLGSAVGSRMMAQHTWTYTAALLCGDSGTSGVHSTLDIVTVQNMIKTRPAIERLIEQFKLECPPQALERSIETSIPLGSRSIFVSMRWSNPAEGETLLNALSTNCVAEVNHNQHELMKQQRASCEARVVLAREALASAQHALAEFSNTADIVDVDGDLASLRDSIDALETSVREQRHNQNVLLTQKNKGSSLGVGLITNRNEISQLQAIVVARRREIVRIKNLRHQMFELTANVDALIAARERAESELHATAQALASPHPGLSVIQPAQLSLSPATSNEKKLFVISFLLSSLVLCCPLLLLEFKGTKENRILDTARKFGLPVLAPGTTVEYSGQKPSQCRATDEEYSRLLALRLQQFAQVPGSVILFSGLDGDAMPVPMLHRLAECLSHRDHRVVVIALDPQYAMESAFVDVLIDRPDSRGGFACPNGDLSGYLSLTHSDIDVLTVPARIPGVDYVLLGKTPLPREGFGTQRMTELINQLRERYTTVIISGPGLNRAVDLELVASRVDGIVLHAFGSRRIDPSASREVQHLMELGAPVLGVIG